MNKKRGLLILIILILLIVGFSSMYLVASAEEEEEEPECYEDGDCPDFCNTITEIRYYNGTCDVDICDYDTYACLWECVGTTCEDFGGNCPAGYCTEDQGCDVMNYCLGDTDICLFECNFPTNGADCEGTCQESGCLPCGPLSFCEETGGVGECKQCGQESLECCPSGASCDSNLWCDTSPTPDMCCPARYYWDGSMCVAGGEECTSLAYCSGTYCQAFSTAPWYYYGVYPYYGSNPDNYACCPNIYVYGDYFDWFTPIVVY